MRILLVNGNTTAAITERCAASARKAAAPGTEIVPATARTGPRIIGTRTENLLAAPEVLRLYAEHRDSIDAVVVAVSLDTGLDALREAARCPVVGMTEAGLLLAATLGGPIGFVAPGTRSLNMYRDVVARVGLPARMAGYEAIDMAPSDFADPSRTLALVGDACRRLVGQGAESILLAGAAFAGVTPDLQREVPVPLVDGIAAAVVMVEGLARLGFPKPRAGSHAALPARELVGLDPAVTRLFGDEA